ncbi:IclR family transcriptional regulator [Vallitalea sp.]|jgi:DNA-binding IclR family transcriptional regulator|uniref:IclR family transcriptional regulator n=1 Tax=Vallitalea sp. TaxID=1882829 RepID=UPI0025EBAA80|nr:IclR family transcriptional regulator [Vallitalea sp.]MCT4686641.1 IclR family transcriptional regulator [Vallitalea sp.]
MQKSTLQTVDRALTILEILSQEVNGLTAKEIENKIELNKSTIHRLLTTLLNKGFIEKNEQTNRYIIGLKMVELSSIRLNNIELKTEALPYLREMSYKLNQPVQLATYLDGDAVFIEKIEPIHSIRMYSQIGKRIPIYCSSVGKALLLQWSNEKILKLLEDTEFTSFTPTTLLNPEKVIKEIEQARVEGFAIDNQEHEVGIYCIASPIYDYRGEIIAAVSTAGTNKEFLENKDAEIIREVKNTAEKISKRMGYRAN